MKIVYKRSLTFIGFLIILISLIGIGYLFYDRVILNETQVVVNDELSINYLDGLTIITDGEYHFSVTNNGLNDVNYMIRLTNISGFNPTLTYKLTSDNVNIDSTEHHLNNDNNVLADQILISSLETQDFTLTVSNNTSTTFEIEVVRINDVEEYFYMTILKNNSLVFATTAVGEEISTTDEGLIESTDDDGPTYYFRGAATNNYVSFANQIWRIIRINGDGTVRLILNDAASTLANYHSSKEDYENFENTSIYTSLNSFYETELSDYDHYITNTKFCSESGKTNQTFNAYTRIVTNKIPTFNCLGDRFTSKIGLITVDEVVFAGGLYDTNNTSYYLYNENIDNIWWTSSLSKEDETSFYPFIIGLDGEISDDTSGSLYRSIRPVISLNRHTVVSGDGTFDNPYTVN